VAGLVAAVVLRPPAAVIRLIARARPDIVFEVTHPARRVALSFDDGPDRLVTPRLLDALRRHHARATFFFLGSRAEASPDVVQRAVSEGHEVGNHLWRDERAAGLSDAEFERSLVRTQRALGVPAASFRPGSGWIGPRKTAIARRHGYRCVLGSIYPYDAQVTLRPRVVADVARRARPGAIIVLHEGRPDRAGVVAAVDDLLRRLHARGYEAVAVRELCTDDALGAVVVPDAPPARPHGAATRVARAFSCRAAASRRLA
jgi:peptidoglycan/xylan/chitin deacetylase (PgdA/CDA1 family)